MTYMICGDIHQNGLIRSTRAISQMRMVEDLLVSRLEEVQWDTLMLVFGVPLACKRTTGKR